MPMKKNAKMKSTKQPSPKEKLQKLSDTYQYAAASKSSNSPSASTRSNTAGIAFNKQQQKMLKESGGKADVSTYTLLMSKRDRMLDAAGKSVPPIFTSGKGKPIIKTAPKKLITGMGGNRKTPKSRYK